MKTALFALAAVVAAPVMAGTTYTVVEPVNPYSMELGVGYNFAPRNVLHVDGVNSSPKVDTMGVDLTGVYTVNENSSLIFDLVLPPDQMIRTMTTLQNSTPGSTIFS